MGTADPTPATVADGGDDGSGPDPTPTTMVAGVWRRQRRQVMRGAELAPATTTGCGGCGSGAGENKGQ